MTQGKSNNSFNQGCLFFSNQLESLSVVLSNDIFTCSSPFTTRLIIVPSPEMGQWLKLEMAQIKGIFCGCEIEFLHQALARLGALVFEKGDQLPKKELSLALLHQKINQLAETEESLKTYIGEHAQRSMQIALELLPLFEKYALYAPHATLDWAEKASDWQAKLWQALYSEGRLSWAHLLVRGEWHSSFPPMKVALFGFSHLPEALFDFFDRLATRCSLSLYHLSPCLEFWSDFLTPREQRRIGLDEHLEKQHPFLANNGKMGREFAKLLENSQWQSEELYLIPKSSNALAQFQRGLLQLENHSIPVDSSVSIHCVSSKKREIEVLYSEICREVVDKGLSPCEIVVMAPDITPYVPYITALFEGVLPYSISDIEESRMDELTLLLNLDQERWSVSSVSALFSEPRFYEKKGWKRQDIQKLERWIEKTGIRWGWDLENKKEYVPHGNFEEGGTWSSGFHQLFESLVKENFPIQDLPFLGDVFSTLECIKEKLKPLKEEKTESLTYWCQYLVMLLEEFFLPNSNICQKLILISQRGAGFGELMFKEFLPWLKSELKQAKKSKNTQERQAIRFSSFVPLRTLPARFIWLLGMNEEDFPRVQPPHPLDKLSSLNHSYLPSSTDYDRFLFLESVLSCREKLVISFEAKEISHSFPSSVVQQFMEHFEGLQPILHPKKSYDPLYFSEGSILKNVNFIDYACAQASMDLLSKDEKSSEQYPALFPQRKTIHLKELEQFVRNPLTLYIKNRFGVSFRELDLTPQEEAFTLAPLDRWQLLQNARLWGFSTAVKHSTRKGQFPQGIFGQTALLKLQEEEILPRLESLYLEVPLIVDGESYLIVGECEKPHDGKLYFDGKKSFESAIKAWPIYLLLSHSLGFPLELYFLRDKKSLPPFSGDILEHLESLIQLVLKARHTPLFMASPWVEPLLEGDLEGLEKQLQAHQWNPLIEWLREGKHLPEAQSLLENSQKNAKKLFERLRSAWF